MHTYCMQLCVIDGNELIKISHTPVQVPGAILLGHIKNNENTISIVEKALAC